MVLEDMYKDASAVFDQATFALGSAWFDSDLPALTRCLRDAPAQGVVVFLTGSRPRGQDRQFAGWMADLPDWLMVAPNTHALAGRPTYTSPADRNLYTQIHQLRIAEIDYCLARLRQSNLIADAPVALVGLSEGAVAALAWRPEITATRVCLAWPCEPSYFTDLPQLPDDMDTPILNVMGGADAYFGPHASLSAQAGSPKGHGAESLADYGNAKVVIYPKCGHRVLDHPQARGDVMGFLNHHLSHHKIKQGD